MKKNMKEINKIYEICGLPTSKKTADISFIHDFPIPNKLISEIVHDFPIPNKLISEMDDSSQLVSLQKKTKDTHTSVQCTNGNVYYG